MMLLSSISMLARELAKIGPKRNMAILQMDKIADTEEYVECSFGRDADIGVLRLNKARGTLLVLSECPLDKNGGWSQRASMRLARLWKEGVYPEKTEWAS
jgi:hypothetical protein